MMTTPRLNLSCALIATALLISVLSTAHADIFAYEDALDACPFPDTKDQKFASAPRIKWVTPDGKKPAPTRGRRTYCFTCSGADSVSQGTTITHTTSFSADFGFTNGVLSQGLGFSFSESVAESKTETCNKLGANQLLCFVMQSL